MKPTILKLTTRKKIILCLLIIIPVISYFQERATWDFPVKPGTESWKLLKNNPEKVSVCQIPDQILTVYEKTDPPAIPKDATILEKGNYVLRLSFIELFASHAAITENSTINDKKEFVKQLVLKKEKKMLNPEWYATFGIQTNMLATVRIIESETNLYKSKLNSPDLNSYVYTGNFLTPELNDLINQVANNFINVQK